ncbi:unnamed protein product, partial [Chrysoparadoxa australica]
GAHGRARLKFNEEEKEPSNPILASRAKNPLQKHKIAGRCGAVCLTLIALRERRLLEWLLRLSGHYWAAWLLKLWLLYGYKSATGE